MTRPYLIPPHGYNVNGTYAMAIELPELGITLNTKLQTRDYEEAKKIAERVMWSLRQEGGKIEADF